MSGETRGQVSGWTVDTLRTYFERIINEHETRNEQRFRALTDANTAAEKAIGTALLAQEREVAKVDAINERRFDAQLNQRRASDDLTRLMMPRNEAEARVKSLEDKIVDLAARIDRTEGRSGGLSAGWGYLIGAIGAAGGVLAIIYALTRAVVVP